MILAWVAQGESSQSSRGLTGCLAKAFGLHAPAPSAKIFGVVSIVGHAATTLARMAFATDCTAVIVATIAKVVTAASIVLAPAKIS